MPTPHDISENFRYAKFFAILLVLSGHYFAGSWLWAPVTVGLFIFAFSSAYFTARRYPADRPYKQFWSAKFCRLLPALLLADLFLLALFIIQGRTSIGSIHTLPAALGLSGILDWIGVHNRSPWGNGLWFLTLLLLYYLAYPLLVRCCATPRQATLFAVLALLACGIAHHTISPPYMLWPTVYGFCLGTCAGRHAILLRASYCALSLAGFTLILAALNLLHITQGNLALILVVAISTCALLLAWPLPLKLLHPLAPLTACVLQIYIIHTYLFLHSPRLPRLVDYLLSLSLILACAWFLHAATQRMLRQRVLAKNMQHPA